MLTRPVVQKEYIDAIREIRYFGFNDDITILKDNEFDVMQQVKVFNNGHCFQILSSNIADLSVDEGKFEVIGWVDRASDFPYDFILVDTRSGKHFVANLHGRSDGWPLFAIQNGKPTCSRLEWDLNGTVVNALNTSVRSAKKVRL